LCFQRLSGIKGYHGIPEGVHMVSITEPGNIRAVPARSGVGVAQGNLTTHDRWVIGTSLYRRRQKPVWWETRGGVRETGEVRCPSAEWRAEEPSSRSEVVFRFELP